MSHSALRVLITGASSGIGFALATAYARTGARLVLNGRDERKLLTAAESLRGSGEIALVPGDISQSDTAKNLMATAVSHFDGADVLLNNAGIFGSKPICDYTEEDIDAYLRVNLRGTILMTQAMVAQLRRQKSGGVIVNITSSISMAPLGRIPGSVPNATKGGLNAFTRSLALELAPEGIRVNAVAPGLIKTPLLGSSEDNYQRLAALQPMGHVGAVEDVTRAVQSLVEQEFTTGVVLPVDGGASLGHW